MIERDDKSKLQDLLKVLEITRSLAAVMDLDSVFWLVIERSMELLDAERASLFLYDSVHNELVSRVAVGASKIRMPAERGIVGETIRSGQTVNVPDAYADARFNRDVDRRTGFRTRNILSVPLRDYEGSLVGVLQVLNKRSGPFDAYDITLAETLGAQAGVALQRARLIEHYVEKQRLERAMKIAQEIQQNLLPKENPQISGFDVAGFSRAADETGGDTYDFLSLDDGRCMLVVADASGHGIGPALVIAETRAMLRAVGVGGCNVAHILNLVNNLLARDLGEARFVTCFLGMLDPTTGHLEYASAGHGPLLFYRRSEDRFTEVGATGLPFGVFEDAVFDNVSNFAFTPGDFAALTTDGIFEASNAVGELFGLERMKLVLRRDRDLPAEQMIANLHQAVIEFTGGAPQADDVTAVVVRRK